MKNSSEKEEGEEQQDDIPRDTQLKDQYIESPSVNDNQQNLNIVSPTNPSGQQYEIAIGGDQYINNLSGNYYTAAQGQQQIQSNEIIMQNAANQLNKAYSAGQENQEIAEEEQIIQNNDGYEEIQDDGEVEEGIEYEEIEENQENLEGEGGDIEENLSGGRGIQQVNAYQISQGGNAPFNQESRSYQINRDGNIYQVNEQSKEYQIGSENDPYQVKKEIKTTKIEKFGNNQNQNQNYPNNISSQMESQKIVTQENYSMKNNISTSLPKDKFPKGYIDSPQILNDFPPGRYTQYYSDIPRYMSFQRSTVKSPTKIRSSLKVVKTENVSELIEIPESQYDKYVGRETVYVGGGMETGEYKFRGQGILVTQAVPEAKVVISEEEILKEINRRKNKKKQKKKEYIIIDKFYAKTEFEGKPIKKIEKVETERKEMTYEEQQKYLASSKGDAAFQISSKASQSQSQQSQVNNQSQQFYKFQSQTKSQAQNQPLSQSQINQMNQMNQMSQMQMKYSQIANNNINNNNSNKIRISNLQMSSSLLSDNYSKYLLEQINKVRANPQSYIRIIESAKKNIIKDKLNRFIYNGKIKVGLVTGELAFNNAINYLKTVKPCEQLIFNPYLCLDLPRSENEIKYRNDLALKVENMINNGINIKSYWREIIRDPDISLLMMIIDDNGDKSGMRRKDLLDPNMKYIGINSVEINGNFVCYITLSSKE